MKEFGQGGYNPHEQPKSPFSSSEALTNQARNPYASNSVNDMEGNNGGPENTGAQGGQGNSEESRRGAQEPSRIVERSGRPFRSPPFNVELADHLGRPIPSSQGVQSSEGEVVIDPRNPESHWRVSSDIRKLERDITNYLEAQYGRELDPNERQTVRIMAEKDYRPPGLNPPENVDDGIIPSASMQMEEALNKEGTPEQRARINEIRNGIEERNTESIREGRGPISAAQLEMEQDMAPRGINPGERPEPKEKYKRWEELTDSEKERERQTRPQNLDQLIIDIMKNSDPKWRHGGDNSLIKENEVTGEFEVNQSNFLLWVMDRITFFHNENPDDLQLNVFAKVRLEREFRDITINDMLENQDRYFKDKQGRMYTELADSARLLLWQFAAFRKDALDYNLAMGEVEGTKKILGQQFYLNTHTKPAFHGRSVLANLLTMAENFDSTPDTFDTDGNKIQAPEPANDTNLGNGLNTAFQIYYNLSDTEKLRDLLSEKEFDMLHSPEWARFLIVQKAKGKGFITGEIATDLENFDQFNISKLTPDQYQQAKRFIESIDPEDTAGSGEFLFTGEPVTQEMMAKFINIYNTPTKNTEINSVANELIKEVIKERYGLHNTSANYAQLMAQFMARPMGAGWRNDLAANANDAAAKPGKMLAYRKKMFGGSRAGMGGNPYSVFMFKGSLVDFLTAARSETLVTNEDGSIYEDKYGNRHNYSLLEMMEMMHRKGRNNSESSKEYMELATRLRPTSNSEKDWSTNHMSRAFDMYEQIINNMELDWHKFTEIDTSGIVSKVRLKRDAFQKEVQDGLFKQTRYMLSTYGQLDFSLNVRYHDSLANDGKGAWVDKPLALALFGEEILDLPEFKDENGKIDPLKINTKKGKELLWKQVALARIVADITAHRDEFSTDKRYNMSYWMHMLEELEHIPGDIEGTETDHRLTKTVGHAFSHSQIDWLKKHGSIEYSTLVKEQAVKDVFGGLLSGFNDALKELFKNLKI